MTMNRILAGALLAATAMTFAAPAAAQRIDRIVAFGDSYADDGNFFQLVNINPLTTVVYTTGRLSGGTNYIDSLGTILGVPIDNFAIGGALADNRNTNGPALGFTTEYTSFLAGGGPAAFPRVTGKFGPNDLLAISIGGNDARFYQQSGGTLVGANAAAATSVAATTTGLNALVAAGARNISFLAGDTGRLPEITANPDAAAIRSRYSGAFNAGIQAPLAGYAANGAIVHYLDLNLVLNDIGVNYGAYGLTGLTCPAFPNPTCVVNPTGFLFYGDQLHLTSDGFRVVAQFVAAQLRAPLTLQAPSDLTLDTARQFGRTLTTRMDLGAPRDGDMPEGLGIYVVGDTFSRKLKATQTNDQFKVSGTGYTAGVEYGFGSGVIGIAGNISKTKANFGNDSSRTEGIAKQVGAYASGGIAGAFVQGYAGFGWDDLDISRRGVVLAIASSTKARHATAGAKAGYLMPMGSLRVGPVVALDYARARVNGYREGGDAALDLNVRGIRNRSLRGSAGAELRGDLGVADAIFRPYLSVVAEKDFTGDDRTFYFSQTASPTIINHYAVADNSKKAYARLTTGISAGVIGNVSVNGDISATFGKKQGDDTTGHLSLRAAF